MYPVMINFENKLCTIVGGGRAALRKAKNLYSDGAVVRVIAPEICAQLADMAHEVIYSEYSAEFIKNSFAVIAATDSDEVNRQILSDCQTAQILCTGVDGSGDFRFCAKADIDGLTVSAYTGGEFPMLGKIICDDMKQRYAGCADLAKVLGRYRREVIKSGQRELIRELASVVKLGMSAEELDKNINKILNKQED